MVGVFFNLGIGIGVTGTSWGAKGAGALPGSINLLSYEDLSLDQFQSATFTVAAFKGPGAGWGDIEGSIASSTFMQMQLLDGTLLDGVSEGFMTSSLAQFNLNSLKEFLEDPKKCGDKHWWPKKVGVTIFRVSEGGGVLGTYRDLPRKIAPPPEVRQNLEKIGTPQCTVETYFDCDSGLISTEKRAGLETALAVYRKLFTDAEAQLIADAFASPEDTPQHNQVLSDARAAALRMGVLDAFGSASSIKQFLAAGWGEEPSEKVGGLIDPEHATPGQGPAIQEQKERAWPLWRRVDLWAAGWLFLRVKPL